MRNRVLGALACLPLAGAAYAGTVAPGDVDVANGGVETSLTGTRGDPAKGSAWFADRKLGNCLACHKDPAMDQPFQGEVGPSLEGVGGRWSQAQLRAIVTNAKTVFPATIMPAFYKAEGFEREADPFKGKTILTAQQVEDVVAYLMTLKK